MSGQWDQDNKEKMSEYKKQWKKANPDKVRNNHFKYKYGITLDDYNMMLEAAAHVCEICKQPEIMVDPQTNKIRRLSVDHNHATGEIRGILCGICNTMLGKYEPYKDVIDAYLEKTNGS